MYRVELKVLGAVRGTRVYDGWLFLMYRVELKARGRFWRPRECAHVPNVPCGVESGFFDQLPPPRETFLMYRVELKDPSRGR